MHSKGVVHRDMNPSNVFILDTDEARDPIVKILDFNVSKLIPLEGVTYEEGGKKESRYEKIYAEQR